MLIKTIQIFVVAVILMFGWRIAGIADAIAIQIGLVRVGRVGTVVARIPDVIAIIVFLACVGQPRAVVDRIIDAIPVAVSGADRRSSKS